PSAQCEVNRHVRTDANIPASVVVVIDPVEQANPVEIVNIVFESDGYVAAVLFRVVLNAAEIANIGINQIARVVKLTDIEFPCSDAYCVLWGVGAIEWLYKLSPCDFRIRRQPEIWTDE